MPSWVRNGSIILNTNSFSPYVITTEKLANSVIDEPTSTESSEVSTPVTTTSVPLDTTSNGSKFTTGIAMTIILIAIIAAVVVVVSKKNNLTASF